MDGVEYVEVDDSSSYVHELFESFVAVVASSG
jgi:hypothetical protein